jgi:hypothetical protein
MMRRLILRPMLACLGILLGAHASVGGSTNTHWVDIRDLGVEGKGWQDTASFYHRLPARAEKTVTPAVCGLSKQTAGMLVRFVSNATNIQARWGVTSENLAMPHMAATGVSGLDLYARHEGRWHWLGVGQPKARTNLATLASGILPGEREFLLYLPLYNGVESVEIGVPDGCKIGKAGPWGEGERRPVVFYGTSISQGGCASRPGMVHSAILGRRYDWPTINLGFSGAGKMEMAMADLISEINASVFVLDCLPNMDANMLKERFEPFIARLRSSHPNTPIVIVEDRPFANAYLMPAQRAHHDRSRLVISEAYRKLKKAGDKNLHYVKGEELLGGDHEGTVDSSHPTDLGFMRQADAFGVVLGPILKQSLEAAAR